MQTMRSFIIPVPEKMNENDGVILKACIKTLRLYKHVNEMKKDYRWNIFEMKNIYLYIQMK